MEAGALISELKRRRVIRALVGYGIAAFAVLQIIEPIMHGLHWPDEVLSYVVVALAVGFPIIVSLAWIFDVNAGRIERTPPSTEGLKGTRLALVLVGIGVLAATPGVVWYFFVRGSAKTAASTTVAPAMPSIAVLPFVNLSSDKEQEYFSDGIAEEILNALAQVDGLRVIGRTSSFSFKGKNEDLRVIAEKLGVAHVLEGSVRKEGDRIRITAQLIEAGGGSHLWSKTFDRELKGIFALQDEIARAVVDALKVKLLPGKHLPETQPTNPEAHTLLLMGRDLWWKGGDPAATLAIVEKVVLADPRYAPGWAYLGMTLGSQTLREESPAQRAARWQRALDAADKAVSLDPSYALAYAARGWVRMIYNWDWAGAKADLERSLSLNPNDARANKFYGGLLGTLGRVDEAVRLQMRATELDPLLFSNWNWLGWTYFNRAQYALARAAFQRQIEVSNRPSDNPIFGIAWSYLLEGQVPSAVEWCDRLADDDLRTLGKAGIEHLKGHAVEEAAALRKLIARAGTTSPVMIAHHYAWRGDVVTALDWLERAYGAHDLDLRDLKATSDFGKLHGDPRWAALLKKMNLPLD